MCQSNTDTWVELGYQNRTPLTLCLVNGVRSSNFERLMNIVASAYKKSLYILYVRP